ncbi:MAG TPA: Sjogren's syndrome/scleroderma autoantigen 1 family protein [Candidatus Krumholzibacteriaceae bacterium]|nr:Sjogren's syndrome/scleroderma autoantigen 1 family protein [Candidatus Krumholzibacteriaceae bacterium]
MPTLSEGSMKKMGELLRQGARMLSDACPECGTPLFQLKNGDTICPMCNKPVKFVKSDADPQAEAQKKRLEESLRKKIDEVQARLDEADDPVLIGELTDTLMKLMEALDRAKKLGA